MRCHCHWPDADGRLPVGTSFACGARLQRALPLGAMGDPARSCSCSPCGGLEKPGAAGEAVGGGGLPFLRAPRAGLACRAVQGAPDCSWPPPPPFLLSPFCRGPFDLGTRPLYVARGLARPPRPTQARGFPFHLELGAPGSERDGRRALGVSQNLGDSAFSGALWPRGFDILSGNGKKGEQGAAGRRSCWRGLRLAVWKAAPLPGGLFRFGGRPGL